MGISWLQVVVGSCLGAILAWSLTFYYLGSACEWCLHEYEDCQAELMGFERRLFDLQQEAATR